MIWSATEKCILSIVKSGRADAWYIQRARRKLPTNRVDVGNLQRRFFVDVSVISKHDACTGIQRVARVVASHLIPNPPDGWEVWTVSASRKQPYQPISWPSGGILADYGPIVAQLGDVFLGLDFALDSVRFHKKQLTVFKHSGGQLWFVMYGLLPVQRPDWFSDKLVMRYRKWPSIPAALADGFYCISPPFEADLRTVWEQRYSLMNSIPTHVIPLGCDIATSQSSKGLSDSLDGVLIRWGSKFHVTVPYRPYGGNPGAAKRTRSRFTSFRSPVATMKQYRLGDCWSIRLENRRPANHPAHSSCKW